MKKRQNLRNTTYLEKERNQEKITHQVYEAFLSFFLLFKFIFEGFPLFLSLVSSPPAGFQIENVLSVLACVQALLAGLGKEKMSHWAKGGGTRWFQRQWRET